MMDTPDQTQKGHLMPMVQLNIRLYVYFMLMLPVLAACGKEPPAETVPLPEGKHYYLGVIAKNLAIQMELSFTDSTVTGSYYYEKNGTAIPLTGKIAKDGTILLKEYGKADQITGEFKGKPDVATRKIRGAWTGKENGKRLRFQLTEVAGYVSSEMKEDNITVTASYPRFHSTAESFQQLNRLLRDSVSREQQDFINTGKEYLQPEDPMYEIGWQKEIDYSIKYYSETLVSILETVSEYTGGAHGNLTYRSFNYHITQDKPVPVKLTDLIVPEERGMAVLSENCLQQLRKKGASEVTGGRIRQFRPEDLSAFTLNPAGITIYFAPYSVASYAEGTFTVLIPYQELKDIIKTKSPVDAFIKR